MLWNVTRPILTIVGAYLCLSVSMAPSWMFTAPAEGQDYSISSNISAAGGGAANGPFTLDVRAGTGTSGEVMQSTNGTVNGMGFWSATLTCPSSVYPPPDNEWPQTGDATLVLTPAGGGPVTRDIDISGGE